MHVFIYECMHACVCVQVCAMFICRPNLPHTHTTLTFTLTHSLTHSPLSLSRKGLGPHPPPCPATWRTPLLGTIYIYMQRNTMQKNGRKEGEERRGEE